MLVVFVLDTSASMNQRLCSPPLSLFDCAKSAVEHFVRVRDRLRATVNRSSNQKKDQYLLVTTAQLSRGNVKVRILCDVCVCVCVCACVCVYALGFFIVFIKNKAFPLFNIYVCVCVCVHIMSHRWAGNKALPNF